MDCKNCHKQIDPDSKFCCYCGEPINKEVKEEKSTSAPNKDVNLWDKFTEIYDSTGDERKVYEDLSSNEVWELIKRISTNQFENFIQDNKDSLNKQPYKVIETLKNVYGWCASGGYWFWMAEALLKDKDLKALKHIELEPFIKEWQSLIAQKFEEHQKKFLPDLEQSMNRFFEYELNTILDSSDSVKDLPNELIDRIKTEVFILIFWGYLGGVAESKYRK
jgi:hypothetical protein